MSVPHLELLTRVCFFLAVVTAWAVATCRKAPFYRPVAVTLSILFGLDCMRGILRFCVLAPARLAGRVPYIGWERVAFHVDQAALLAFAAASVALAGLVFLRPQRARSCVVPAALVWLVLTTIVALSYPELRLQPLESVYTWVARSSAAIQSVCAGIFFARRQLPMAPQRAALILLAVDIGALLGPYLMSKPSADWAAMRAPALLLWGILSLLQGSDSWLWTRTLAQKRHDTF